MQDKTIMTPEDGLSSEDRKLAALADAEKVFQETLAGHGHKQVAEALLDIYDPKSMTKEQQRAISVIIKFCRTKVMECVHEQN